MKNPEKNTTQRLAKTAPAKTAPAQKRKQGRPPVPENLRRLRVPGIRLPRWLVAELRETAVKKGISLTCALESAVKNWLESKTALDYSPSEEHA